MDGHIRIDLYLVHKVRSFVFIRIVVQFLEFVLLQFLHGLRQNLLIGIEAHL